MHCPNGITPMGNSGCLPRRKTAAIESRYAAYGVCLVLWCFHNPPNTDMDNGIFNVCTDLKHAIAHGDVGTMFENLHWKWTLGENSLAAPGNRTCVSGVPVRCSTNWTTSPDEEASSISRPEVTTYSWQDMKIQERRNWSLRRTPGCMYWNRVHGSCGTLWVWFIKGACQDSAAHGSGDSFPDFRS